MPVSIGTTWMSSSKMMAGASRMNGSHQPLGRGRLRCGGAGFFVGQGRDGPRTSVVVDMALLEGVAVPTGGAPCRGVRLQRPARWSGSCWGSAAQRLLDLVLRVLQRRLDVGFGDRAAGGDLGEHVVHRL